MQHTRNTVIPRVNLPLRYSAFSRADRGKWWICTKP